MTRTGPEATCTVLVFCHSSSHLAGCFEDTRAIESLTVFLRRWKSVRSFPHVKGEPDSSYWSDNGAFAAITGKATVAGQLLARREESIT